MLRISPDGKKFERYAYGLRFAYGMAFNEAGDLFCSDNEGGGNPTEEINHIVKGGNYGHHPKLADSPPIPPLLAITPHLSTDGIDFNPTSNNFGGTGGDLFIASWGPDGQWSKGGVFRARLKKQPDGKYTGDWSYLRRHWARQWTCDSAPMVIFTWRGSAWKAPATRPTKLPGRRATSTGSSMPRGFRPANIRPTEAASLWKIHCSRPGRWAIPQRQSLGDAAHLPELPFHRWLRQFPRP